MPHPHKPEIQRHSGWMQCIVLIGFCCSSVTEANEEYKVVRSFLSRHCYNCHGETKQNSDLRLDTLSADFDAVSAAEVWTEVMDILNRGEMPPQDQPRPDSQIQQQVVQWIAGQLREARRRQAGRGQHVLMRRLNRDEYANTIRDLFQIDFLPGENPADLLPPDAEYEGFRKVSSALMLDSSLLESYYEAARRVAELAIVSGPPEFPTHLSHFEMEDMAKKGSGFSYVCGHGGCDCGDHDVRLLTGNTRTARGLLYPGTEQIIPVKGWYTIRVRASADSGDENEPVRMFVERQNGREGRLMELDVTAPRHAPQVYSATVALDALTEARGVYMKVGIVNGAKRLQPHQITQPEKAIGVGIPDFFTFEKAMKEAASAGNHAESLRLAARRRSEGWTGSTRPGMGLLDPSPLRKLYIDWIEIEGPLYEQWPPQSHREIFFRNEDTPKDLKYVREIFARFLPRAFRRPVLDVEIDRVVDLVQQELDLGLSFHDAVRQGITYALTTPAFLYIVEPSDGLHPRPLNDYELASRLSYFLWSSMPDDRLLKLAAEGRLQDPERLSDEVNRMLDDPRSRALVDEFAAQWLKTDEFLEFQPDQKIYADFYRSFDSELRPSMDDEPLAFFAEVLYSDLSVMNFIDSDFVVVNRPLAEFYGLPERGPFNSRSAELEFRRVDVPPGSPRGGLLGQAGIHMRGSDGIRTKPVNRGVYVREVLFNDPPDPPPPNAGEVEPNIEGERLTVRERLLQHQQIEACAGCHRGIDAFGLALENFDVTGAWRDRQNGEEFRGANAPAIDSSGTLPNGDHFTDFQEFKSLLLSQKERFRRALCEKLFLYAIGRPVTAADRDTIDEISRNMADRDDTLRTLIQSLVRTSAFRIK